MTAEAEAAGARAEAAEAKAQAAEAKRRLLKAKRDSRQNSRAGSVMSPTDTLNFPNS